jgi:hypothetical protein
MRLVAHGPEEIGWLHSVARSGQESIAQGLPWETRSNVKRPEGAPSFGKVIPERLVSGRPFRASTNKPKTQGKPWAEVSWPFGPPEPRSTAGKLSSLGRPGILALRKVQPAGPIGAGPPSLMNGTKHIRWWPSSSFHSAGQKSKNVPANHGINSTGILDDSL